METLLRIAGLCLLTAVVTALLRQNVPALGVLLAVSAAVLGCVLLAGAARELAALWEELTELTGLSPELFLPLLKVTAVSFVARLCGALCTDAGQSALAKLMDAAGALCALGCALPLLRAVVDLLRGWL